MTVTIDSEVSGIMRANIDGKVNLNVLSGDVREESQAQSEEQEEKRKKKQGSGKILKSVLFSKRKVPQTRCLRDFFWCRWRGSNPHGC